MEKHQTLMIRVERSRGSVRSDLVKEALEGYSLIWQHRFPYARCTSYFVTSIPLHVSGIMADTSSFMITSNITDSFI